MTRGDEPDDRRRHVVDATFGDDLFIRLVDPPASAVRQVETELGAVETEPGPIATGTDPVLTVRFTAPLADRAGLTTLGLSDHPFAFDGERFYLVGRRGHLAHLDFATLDTAEIEIERGETEIPLLMPLVALRLVGNRRVLLHAAAFEFEGRTVVTTGWQSGGKSEVLFAFMDRGATYLADEWTIIREDGEVEGIASAVHFWDWQLRELPAASARVPRAELRRLAVLRMARSGIGVLAGAAGHGSVRRTLRQLGRWLDNAARARLAPGSIYDGQVGRGPSRLDVLLLASVAGGRSDAGRGCTVNDVDGREVAARIAASLEYERRDLAAAYAQYRYAFPDRASRLVETVSHAERAILERAFSGVRAHEVRHRYPPSFAELYEVVSAAL